MKSNPGICFLLACSLAVITHATAPAKNELVIGTVQEFEVLNPMLSMGSRFLLLMTNRPLVYSNVDGETIPMLAKEIPSLKNKMAKLNPDGKTMTVIWNLKEEAKWSDGAPIICDDLELARRIGSAETVTVTARETFTAIQKIEAIKGNPKSCLFTYSRQAWDFQQLSIFYPMPSHLEKKIFDASEKIPQEYERKSNYAVKPTLAGLHSGPYIIKEVKFGSHVTLAKNPHFAGGTQIEKIIVKVIPNTNTLKAELQTGQVQLVSWMGGIGVDLAEELAKNIARDKLPLKLTYEAMNNLDLLSPNLDFPALSSKKTRKALSHAINRRELVESLYRGKAVAADQLFGPTDVWRSKDPKSAASFKHDPALARKLLDEEGWKLNTEDGFRYKDGKKFSFTLYAAAGKRSRELLQTYLQKAWRDLGAEVLAKNFNTRVLISDILKYRKHEGMIIIGQGNGPEDSRHEDFHSTKIPAEANGWSGRNRMGWKNAESDRIWDQMEKTFDPAARKKLAAEFTKLFAEELPLIPIVYPMEVAVYPANMKGYRINVNGVYETFEVEKWKLE